MRLFAVLVAICALPQTAIAQSGQCKSIGDPGARLACYDKATPLAASPDKSAAPRPMTAVKPSDTKVDAAQYIDTISAEDALMNARLKNICRGC
jgi:hypothetical protein